MAINLLRRPGAAVAGLAALMLVALMVGRASSAAFTAASETDNSAWESGTVILTDDDTGTALFDSATDGALDGGQSQTRCIQVTYAGSLNPTVRMYGSATGALAPYLNLTIDEGTGGAAGSCTGFASSAAVYNGTVAGLSGSHFNFGTGAGQWSPQPAAVKTYRFTVTVQNAPAAQGATADATFVWEAQTGTPAPPVVGASADNFADATVLTFPAPGTPTVADFNLTGATFEQWEPDNSIMWTGEPDTGSVWYQFTAPANMYVGVNTFPGADLPNAACNTILQILEGPVDQQAPNVIAENADAEPTGDQNQTCATQSEVYFPVTSGTTYYINVQGWAAVDMTSGRLRLFQAAPPTYDNLADAIELGPVSVGSHDTLYHRTSVTTTEPDEPGPPGARTIWVEYTPAVNQHMTLYPGFVSASVFDGGPGMTNLNLLAASAPDPGQAGEDVLDAELIADQTYYFQITAPPGIDKVRLYFMATAPN